MVTCTDCDRPLSDPPPPLCPGCGSLRKTVTKTGGAAASVKAGGHYRVDMADPPGPHSKRRREARYGTRTDAEGRHISHHRYIDRDGGVYGEVIRDLDTGEIIRDKLEPLSGHRGRGSAKQP